MPVATTIRRVKTSDVYPVRISRSGPDRAVCSGATAFIRVPFSSTKGEAMSHYHAIEQSMALFRGPKRGKSTPATEFSIENNSHSATCKVRKGKSCSCGSKEARVSLTKSKRKGRVIGRIYAPLEPAKPEKSAKSAKRSSGKRIKASKPGQLSAQSYTIDPITGIKEPVSNGISGNYRRVSEWGISKKKPIQ